MILKYVSLRTSDIIDLLQLIISQFKFIMEMSRWFVHNLRYTMWENSLQSTLVSIIISTIYWYRL